MIGELGEFKKGDDSTAMMDAAIDRARRLLEELERDATDLKKNPPKLPPVDLEMGMRAMDGALGSARRLLASLLAAREAAGFGETKTDRDE